MESTQKAEPLTKQDLQNIIAFLERSTLTGKESFVFVPLVTKLMAMLRETPIPKSEQNKE